MSIGTTDTAALYFNKDIIIPNLGNGILLDIILLQSSQHSHSCCLGNLAVSGFLSMTSAGLAASVTHMAAVTLINHIQDNLLHNFFNINTIQIHCALVLSIFIGRTLWRSS